MTHTPGPWKVVGTEIWAGTKRITMGSGAFDETDRATRRANARLIAKAPEMYASLQELVHLVDGVSDWTPSSDVKIGRARALLREIEEG